MSIADFQIEEKTELERQVSSLHVPEISIIVAVQGQKEELETINAELHRVLQALHQTFEIVYVDDGSVDGSWPLLKKIASKSSSVKLVRLRTRFGESSALDAGERVKNTLFHLSCPR